MGVFFSFLWQRARSLRWLIVSRQQRFARIFKDNRWGSEESASGVGSTLSQTLHLRPGLTYAFRKHNINRLVDAPCGDFNWMKEIVDQFDYYVGVDIVPELIERNNRLFRSTKVRFQQGDLVRDVLPLADAILCRDCLVHLSFADIWKTITLFKQSGSRFLATTTFTDDRTNRDIITGEWRPLNLMRAPFNFPAPEELINERCSERNGAYADKCVGIWRLDNISARPLTSSPRRSQSA